MLLLGNHFEALKKNSIIDLLVILSKNPSSLARPQVLFYIIFDIKKTFNIIDPKILILQLWQKHVLEILVH